MKFSLKNYKNIQLKKSKKWDFSKGFLSKIGDFSIFFLIDKIGQENVFYDILERKNAFLDYKNIKLKKWKNWDFSYRKNWDFFKGVSQWFLSKKWQFSHLFILGKIGQEKVFYDILDKKTPF